MKITLKQIADIAGVSRGTVDRALHNREGINPQVRDRILEVAESLGYKPNIASKQLLNLKVRPKFGVILARNRGGFWDEVHRGVNAAKEELTDYGVTVLLRECNNYTRKEQLFLINQLLDEGIAGLAIVPINDPIIQETLNSVIASGIPVVVFNSEIENVSPLCYVGSDYELSGRTAAGLLNLIAKNQRIELLVCTGSKNMYSHTTRVTSFLQELDRLKVDCNLISTCKIYDENETSDGKLAYNAVRDLLEKHPETTAVFTTAGSVSSVADAIRDSGLMDHITHLSFDLDQTSSPALENGTLTAVIDQEPFQQGYQPIRILFDYLVNNIPPANPRIIMQNGIFIKQNLTSWQMRR